MCKDCDLWVKGKNCNEGMCCCLWKTKSDYMCYSYLNEQNDRAKEYIEAKDW